MADSVFIAFGNVPNFPVSFTAGDLLYASNATTIAGLADVATGSVLVSGGVGAAPAWSANPVVNTLSILRRTKLNNDGTMNWGSSADFGELTWNTGVAIVRAMSGKRLGLASNGSVDHLMIDTAGNVAIQSAKTFGWSTDTFFVRTLPGVVGMTSTAGGSSTGAVVFGGTTPSITAQGSNAQKTITAQATSSVTCNSGTSTVTAASLIPAGSIVYGVTARVTTTLSGASLTTWKLGDGTTANAWGNTLALAVDTISDSTTNTYLSTWAPTYYGTATNVILTANAGQFDAGVVRLTVHYISLAAAAS